ncbi:hypothetical protein CapIbe_001894 [Capra ibex]
MTQGGQGGGALLDTRGKRMGRAPGPSKVTWRAGDDCLVQAERESERSDARSLCCPHTVTPGTDRPAGP